MGVFRLADELGAAAAEKRRDRRELARRKLLVHLGENRLEMLDRLARIVEREAPALQARGDEFSEKIRIFLDEAVGGKDRGADRRHAVICEAIVVELGALGLELDLVGVHGSEDGV